jgi:hypothetical protein
VSKHTHKDKHKRRHKDDTPKMTTLQELEELYTSVGSPIEPINGYSKKNPTSDGWKFYQKVREKLPAWWEEFNGDLDSDGRLKYTSIRRFIKHKTGRSREQLYLHEMIGPADKHDSEVPWLGDWEKRRRNGFGVLDNPGKIRPLIKVIQNNMAAAESIKSMTPILVEELVQYSAIQKQVHEAFAGQAFGKGKANDKHNVSRFETYKTMLWALTQLKINIVHEIMRCHGVDPNAPQQMREMAQIAGGIGAAAALTGLAAGQRGIAGVTGGVVSTDGTTIAPFTYDAIKLAEHLTRHAHTFKKPLPSIEGEGSIHEEDPSASASSSKSNGKPQ